MPETDRYDCGLCRRSNNVDNMVFCPKCEEWYHYMCVGVNDAVVDQSWVCSTCLTRPTTNLLTSTPIFAIPAGIVGASGLSAVSPPIPSTASSEMPPNQVTSSAGNLVNPGQSILTEQARESLRWVQEQREIVERETEENHRLELERKRLELKRLTNKALLGILNDTRDASTSSSNDQAAAVGVSTVGNWMQGIVGEMQNLSIAQASGMPEKSFSGPTFDISSTPTTAGVSVNSFEQTLSSAILSIPSGHVSLPPTTNVSFPTVVHQLPINTQSEIDRPLQASGTPSGFVSRVPPGLGLNYQTNVVTACSTVPTVGLTSTRWGPCGVPLNNPPPTILPPLRYQHGLVSGVLTSVNAPATQSAIPNVGLNYGVLGGGYGSYPFQVPEYTTVAGGLPFGQNNIPGLSSVTYPHPGSEHAANFSAGGRYPASQGTFPGLQRLHDFASQYQVLPTQHQLMARQVMPKDLPSFRGDPEDWPLFYSAYLNSTAACGYSDVKNLSRLQKALQGKAFDAVKSRLLLPACVPQVLSTLYMLYGRPELIIQTLLNKVREVPAPKSDKLETLITFGMTVQNLCDHLEAAGQIAHMCNPILLQELVEKIPAHLRLDWALYKRQFAVVDLKTFATYMSTLVAAASDVTLNVDSRQSQAGRSDRVKEKNFLNAHSTTEPSRKECKEENMSGVVCLACNGPNHKVKDCVVFKKWDPENRWEIVRDYHLCKMCLGKHGQRPCKQQGSCGIGGCQFRHHQLLHTEMQQQPIAEKQQAETEEGSREGVNAHHSTDKSTLFRIIPVKLFWGGKSVETYAFLDDGSSMTLIEQSVADGLGIDDGKSLPLGLTWTGNINRQVPDSKRVSIDISGMGDSKRFALNDTRTVTNLRLPIQTLKYEELARQYAHLRGLPISSYDSISPGILIGANNASLISTLKLREGEHCDPIAAKTRLGWSIYGHVADGRKQENFSFHIREYDGTNFQCIRNSHDNGLSFFEISQDTKRIAIGRKQTCCVAVIDSLAMPQVRNTKQWSTPGNSIDGSLCGIIKNGRCLMKVKLNNQGFDQDRMCISECKLPDNSGGDRSGETIVAIMSAMHKGKVLSNAESARNRVRYGRGNVTNSGNTDAMKQCATRSLDGNLPFSNHATGKRLSDNVMTVDMRKTSVEDRREQ